MLMYIGGVLDGGVLHCCGLLVYNFYYRGGGFSSLSHAIGRCRRSLLMGRFLRDAFSLWCISCL